MRYREPCGCVHDGSTWLKFCEACSTEFNERHVQAAIDHAEREADRQRAEQDVGRVLDIAYGRITE